MASSMIQLEADSFVSSVNIFRKLSERSCDALAMIAKNRRTYIYTYIQSLVLHLVANDAPSKT